MNNNYLIVNENGKEVARIKLPRKFSSLDIHLGKHENVGCAGYNGIPGPALGSFLKDDINHIQISIDPYFS